MDSSHSCSSHKENCTCSHSETEQEAHVIQETLSHNINFKSVIQKYPEKTSYEVLVYEWKEGKENTSFSEVPVWEKVGGPFLVESITQAESIASEHLHTLAGEREDTTISAETLQWAREFSGDPHAEFLDISNFSIQTLKDQTLVSPTEKDYIPCAGKSILAVHELYIVETLDAWSVGILEEKGKIKCWKEFASLKEALAEISSDNFKF